MESMVRYISPVNPAVFPHLASVLLLIGTFFTAWFFVFEVSRPKLSSSSSNGKEGVIFKELLISLFASIFLGFGVLFLLLSVGIYV
ncbi:AAEL012511-PA [Aedes aegypti]|uniref:Dolichyl-diphosphooligosaccharide-protein glycosyltransferase subunit TMEM258 n=2 Tax=Aedes aegypti TaxID=7159 RepID=Q16LV9_AEDAE|nr:transmembrane protein 258 homolog [Aedes aegypti]XP_021696953.1 transmembrane protein 258 homolog [Aedes aegypti]EAT35315.1 AAEL012511-PA [Aedes aegypti]